MAPTPEYLKLKFAEAINYFRRKVPIPTENWRQFQAEQHDFAFTIAGLTRANLVDDARWLINRSIEEGIGLDDFKLQFRRLIERRGWTPAPLPVGPEDWRIRIIFETNLRRAHAAGRFTQQMSPSMVARRPYLRWRHRDTRNPRPTHLALDGQVFPATHVFWRTAYPSCAYGCQCTAQSLSVADMERLNLRVSTPPEPNTIAEPGFRRAPGTSPVNERREIINQGLSRLSPPLETQARAYLNSRDLL